MAGRFGHAHAFERKRLADALLRRREASSSPPPPPLPPPPHLNDDDTDSEDDDLPYFVERYEDTGTCPCGGRLDGAASPGAHYVWVAFLNYDNDEEGYRREEFGRDYRALATNYWTTVLSWSTIFHCQMFFWNQHLQTFVTFSVDAYAKRVWADTKKQFSRGWRFVRIQVSREQEVAMYHFFRAQLAAGKPFNSLGAYLLFFRPVDTMEESWFCSQLDVAALQRAGFLEGVQPHATSPAELHRLLVARAEFRGRSEETDNPVLSRPVTAVIGRQHVSVSVAAAAAAAAAATTTRQTDDSGAPSLDSVALRF